MKQLQTITDVGGRFKDLKVCVEEHDDDEDDFFVQLADEYHADERVKSIVEKSWQGFKSGYSPTLCEAGVGGTYFMKDSHNRLVGVFKPHDEEMGCLNNPKGFTPKSGEFYDYNSSGGVQGGEAAFRECAAYLLDHEHFSGVPATALVVANHLSFNHSPTADSFLYDDSVKIGSFQEYMEHDYDAQDISPSKAARFPVKEVHKIAVLDMRLFNTDRHGGNILVRKVQRKSVGYCSDSDCDEKFVDNGAMQFRMDFGSDEETDDHYSYLEDDDDEDEDVEHGDEDDSAGASLELIPIDHGYTLPHSLAALADSRFEWLNWPQSKVPFDSETLDYIARLDPHKDVALLKERFPEWISSECYNVLIISSMWLKIGAKHNLTPYEIGCFMCRSDPDVPSELEVLCSQALGLTPDDLDGASSIESHEFDGEVLESLAAVMEEAAEQKSGDVVPNAQGIARRRPVLDELCNY